MTWTFFYQSSVMFMERTREKREKKGEAEREKCKERMNCYVPFFI